MSDKKSDWVYDELLCFLGSAFFQVPVNGFIEVKCLIFDPCTDDLPEYKKVHEEYKEVVEKLLDAFCKDTKLKHEQVIKALNDMNAKKDIREIFQGLFELVLAMDDYPVFVTMMTQKNIELQQQALMLILKTQGALPESLMEGSNTSPPPAPRPQDTEEEIMKRVLEQSKREYEDQQKQLKRQETKDKEAMEKTITLSKHEVVQLEEQKQTEKQKLNAAMANLTVQEGSKPMPALVPLPTPAAQKPTQQTKQQPVIGTPGESVKVTSGGGAPVAPKPSITVTGAGGSEGAGNLSASMLGPGLLPMSSAPKISSSEAAANWLKSAQDETSTGGNNAVQKAAAAMAGMSAEEIKKRQEYLRQQRDKLIAMKKKEREKQLLTAEQSNPGRPASSRAARQTLDGEKLDEKKPGLTPEEQKKIEMRRQIANKLKAELMDN